MDVLCIGTVVVDIMACPMPAREQWKDKQRIKEIRIQIGGDGANQSIHLADLGVNTWFCACVGNDENGRLIRTLLEKRSVQCDYIAMHPQAPTGTALVLVDESGNRNAFSVHGAHSELSGQMLNPKRHFDGITIGSLLSLPKLEREGLADYLADERSENGTIVFADLGPDKEQKGLDGIRDFLPQIDYFLPSDYDALKMTGADNVETAADVYRACGCRHVIIKCGSRGCYYDYEEEKGWVDAIPVIPVDTTGAGDCMVALFASRILLGESVLDACRFACAGASLSTCYAGASQEILTEQRICEFLAQHN